MNPGLLYLLSKQTLGTLRRARRKLKGPKGIAMFIGVALAATLMIGPQIWVSMISQHAATQVSFQGLIDEWGPHALLLMAIMMSVSSGGLYFRPAEVTHLFPAPISRRDLLLYNILCRMKVQIFSGLLVSIFIARYGTHWYGGVAGCVLFLIFIQLTSQLGGLFFATVGDRLARPVKRFGAIAILGAVAFLVSRHTGFGAMTDFSQIFAGLESVRETPGIKQAAWITRPFIEVLGSPDVSRMLLWSAASIGVLAILVAIMMALDVAFLESAVATSRKVQKKLERARGGGGAMSVSGPSKARFSLPHLPFLGGAGALAWRQLTEVTRHPKPILMLGFMMALFLLPMSMMSSIRPEPADGVGFWDKVWVLVPMVAISTLMTMHLTFDFRRDVDRLAFLKSLPLRPFGVACGQLIANTMLLTVLQLVAASFLAMRGSIDVLTLLVLTPVLLLINWVSVGFDNLFFLLMPHRIVPKDPGQSQFMGRLMLATLLKWLSLMVTLAFAAIPAIAIHKVIEGPDELAALSTTPVLAAFALLFTWLVGRSFQSFDVSKDIPI